MSSIVLDRVSQDLNRYYDENNKYERIKSRLDEKLDDLLCELETLLETSNVGEIIGEMSDTISQFESEYGFFLDKDSNRLKEDIKDMILSYF